MKYKKIVNRGTSTVFLDVGKQNWAGDDYRTIQQEKIRQIGRNLTIHLGRGVRTIGINDLPEPKKRPSTEGRTRITNRGTSSRRSTNKGTQFPG